MCFYVKRCKVFEGNYFFHLQGKNLKKNCECSVHNEVLLGLKWFKPNERQVELMFVYNFTHSNNTTNNPYY